MQDERGKHLNHLEQSSQGKPGSQEPQSALCYPPMVLKSLKLFFLKVFLTLRGLSHKQVALHWMSEGQMVPLSTIQGVHPTVLKQHCWRHPAQECGAELI